MDSKEVAFKSMKAISSKGAHGGIFQTQELRKELGFSEDSEEAHYLHNVVARLKRQGALKAQSGRKRNQYLRVADYEKLRKGIERNINRRAPGNGTRSAPGSTPEQRVAAGGGPPRVVYLEDRVDRVEHGLDELRAGIEQVQGQVEKGLADLRQRLDDLIEMWS